MKIICTLCDGEFIPDTKMLYVSIDDKLNCHCPFCGNVIEVKPIKEHNYDTNN